MRCCGNQQRLCLPQLIPTGRQFDAVRNRFVIERTYLSFGLSIDFRADEEKDAVVRLNLLTSVIQPVGDVGEADIIGRVVDEKHTD